ncbi:GFA family protein [Shewanella dokdonensis]|uniref:GFA family protein n=1 Tax=Shewanella dokdonensis TaxID=712036 RepID=A0ABX8DF94_9GAMM|nr:GFA family protein [Shewanella dokdonensis]MCL1074970.1 GFA family protein [Shewanella dokdonensis]QVK23402.1 GFA family protein [Shewanella dokdonensis]
MTVTRGSCLCGAVTFEIDGQFDRFLLCHCSRCRKDTGSAHAANLFSFSAKLTWLSGAQEVSHFRLTGSHHGKSFCRHCGSALPTLQMDNKLLLVPAGCLDTVPKIMPEAHIFTDSKAHWERHFDKLPAFPQLPK